MKSNVDAFVTRCTTQILQIWDANIYIKICIDIKKNRIQFDR